MRNIVLTLLIMFVLNINFVNAENIIAKQKAKEKLSQMDVQEIMRLHKSKFISEESRRFYKEYAAKNKINSSNLPVLQSDDLEVTTLPENFRTPGEFEESQAVFISWPSYAYDKNGNPIGEVFTPGKGYNRVSDGHGGYTYVEVDVEGYFLDLYDQNQFAPLWAKLADAIQKEAPVWIRVAAPNDTTALKDYMISKGTPLFNYEFLIDEDGENAFWARDFGPFGVYYGAQDSIMFVNTEYYPGRPIDDDFPIKLARLKGYKYYKSPLEIEGGNFMTDGHGTGFYGNVIYQNNSDAYGHAEQAKTPMTSAQVNSEISKIFDLSQPRLMTSLRCDGGTGHIDIYTKLINDEEILITKYPDVYNSTSFPDYATANSNRTMISSKTNSYGKKFRFLEVPLPTDDNGQYGRTTCNTFGSDARGYINGLTINKTFIVPTYSNSSSGNKDGDEAGLEVIRKHMPGYKVVPIDARLLTPFGGAIHCITMQIPAENPVFIQHEQLKGALDKSLVMTDDSHVEIFGKARNRSGFESGKLFCRKFGDSQWNETELALSPIIGVGTSDFSFDGAIDLNAINAQITDTIEYYLKFDTKNGKTAYKPYTAPEGYNSFYFGSQVSVNDNLISNNDFKVFPNPANDFTYLSLPEIQGDYKIEVTDMVGNIKEKLNISSGINLTEINTANYYPGIYFVKIETATGIYAVKFTVVK